MSRLKAATHKDFLGKGVRIWQRDWRKRKIKQPGRQQARTDRQARRPGTARRLLREPRHRHAHAGRQLHSRGHGSRAAIRKRNARHRPVSLRGRGRRRPDQRRQGNGDRNSRHQLFFQRRFVRHDPRRAREHDRARRAAGGRKREPRELGDPRQKTEGHGRSDGPGGKFPARDHRHGTRHERRPAQDPEKVHASAHRTWKWWT